MPKKLQRPQRPVLRRRKRPQRFEDDLDLPAKGAAMMLYDPCSATLVPSVYPGDSGYINRGSVGYQTGNATNETAFCLIQKFGNNVAYSTGALTDTTNFTIAYADTQAPLAGFLNSVATKARCCGGCMVVRPASSPNNATGVIRWGVLPASTLAEGTSTNVAQISRLLTNSVVASQALMQPLEIKWSPGTFDDRYSPTTGITSDDDTDRNILVVVGFGFPLSGAAGTPGTGVITQATAIYEWTPTAAINTNIDSTTVKPSRCDFNCVLRNLKRKDTNWWWSLGKKTLKLAESTAAGYFSGGAIGAYTAIKGFM